MPRNKQRGFISRLPFFGVVTPTEKVLAELKSILVDAKCSVEEKSAEIMKIQTNFNLALSERVQLRTRVHDLTRQIEDIEQDLATPKAVEEA
jgi:hypothetical protein